MAKRVHFTQWVVDSVCFFFSFFNNLLAVPLDRQDLILPTRVKPALPALEVWSLNHWTTREAPSVHLMESIVRAQIALPHLSGLCVDMTTGTEAVVWTLGWELITDGRVTVYKQHEISILPRSVYERKLLSVETTVILAFWSVTAKLHPIPSLCR